MRLVRGSEEWDVQLEGLIVRLDRPGAPPAFLRCETAADARAAADDEIAARLAEGFLAVADPVVDLDARMVYADELQLRRDPRGELILVHRELAELGQDPAGASEAAIERARRRLEHRAAAIIDEHHDAWFGALARFVHKPARKPPAHPALEVAWRLGFAEEARLCGSAELAIEAAYARLRELPLSRELRRLVLGSPDGGTGLGERSGYQRVLDAMLEHGIPSRLGELVIGDDQPHRRPQLELGDLRPVVAAAPALETVRIVGGHGWHSGISLASDRLRVLELRDVTRNDLRQLAEAELPRLEELILRARSPIPAPAVFDVFPSLSRLTLERFERAGVGRESLVEYLATSAPASLRALALPRCSLDDRDLAAALRTPDRLAALVRIDLRGNAFSQGGVAAAKRRLPGLRTAR